MNTVTDIQFQFTDEHQQFRESLRRFLKDTSAVTSVRSLMETESGYDQQVWQRLNGELGLQGLIVPEQYGGSGFGMMEMGIAMEEMGRALYCGPFFSSAVRWFLTPLGEENPNALPISLCDGGLWWSLV